MKNVFIILIALVVLCSACEYKLKLSDSEHEYNSLIEVRRYDRLESRYLTTGDFSALQQMSTSYPMETRILIEEILKLGQVTDPDINTRFLNFYQNTILQTLISDTEAQYANMDDINKELTNAFRNLKAWLPDLEIPMFYAQICALDQSVVVSDEAVGISLDKYLGEDYPLYVRYYSPEQRKSMTRENILPDCLSFYLMSKYTLENFDFREQAERDTYTGKIQWTVNKILTKPFFKSKYIQAVDKYMQENKDVTIDELLKDKDYSKFSK